MTCALHSKRNGMKEKSLGWMMMMMIKACQEHGFPQLSH